MQIKGELKRLNSGDGFWRTGSWQEIVTIEIVIAIIISIIIVRLPSMLMVMKSYNSSNSDSNRELGGRLPAHGLLTSEVHK